MPKVNSGYKLRVLLLAFAVVGSFIILINGFRRFSWHSDTDVATLPDLNLNRSSSTNDISSTSETRTEVAAVTCNRNEAESFAEDRVRSLGQIVLGSGFTTIETDDRNCNYVVQGLILSQQAGEGKLVQMVVIKDFNGWRVNAVQSYN